MTTARAVAAIARAVALAVLATLVVVLAGCHRRTSLPSTWGIPPQELDGAALSRDVVLIADNQSHYLYGDPVLLRSGFTNQFVSVAIRSVQLDFYAPDMLRWIVDDQARQRIIHLGDALDVGCTVEFDAFAAVMREAELGWVMAPGNHDAFYFGNGQFAWEDWQRACRTADGRGAPMTKDRFVEAYLGALAAQPPFGLDLPPDLEGSGRWQARAGAGEFLRDAAWHVDRERPWRSFVAQRLDLTHPGSPRRVVAILLDTSQYSLRPGLLPIYPFRNAGVTGQFLDDQIAVVDRWIAEAAPGQVTILMGHHPYDFLTSGARGALDRWRRDARAALYVSAHTHTAQYFVHESGDARWVELNVGSTTDWPPEFRTLQVSTARGYGDRVALRVQRYPLHQKWNPECEEAWEVRSDEPDFYVAYTTLTTPDSTATQQALMDTLLRSHAWLLRFARSAEGNTTWPDGAQSDAGVQEQIRAALAPGVPLDAKVALLRRLDAFERAREVESEEIRRNFHLCQAKWASKYDLAGARALAVDDSYLLVPAE